MNEKIAAYDVKMTKTINNLDGELATIRAGRANPHVLDSESDIPDSKSNKVSLRIL